LVMFIYSSLSCDYQSILPESIRLRHILSGILIIKNKIRRKLSYFIAVKPIIGRELGALNILNV
jgi:hypothetical protein